MKLALAALVLNIILQGCAYSHASMWNLSTGDCGKSWRVIPAGEALPAFKGVCGYSISLPDSPLSGDTDFKVNFKLKVIAELKSAFTYRIQDPISYVQNARFLGKPNANNADSTTANSQVNSLEIAENTIIDKTIREVTSKVFIEQDITDYDLQKVESVVLEETNRMLKAKGISIDFIALTVIPDTQTKTALDVVSASRIYEAAGLKAEGAKIMEAKASAPSFNFNPTTFNNQDNSKEPNALDRSN